MGSGATRRARAYERASGVSSALKGFYERRCVWETERVLDFDWERFWTRLLVATLVLFALEIVAALIL